MDLKDKQKVNFGQLRAYSEKQGVNFLEVSALSGYNIEELFYISVKKAMEKYSHKLQPRYLV